MIGDKFFQLGFREKDLLPEPDIAYFMFLVSKPAFRAAENFAGFFQGVKLGHDSPPFGKRRFKIGIPVISLIFFANSLEGNLFSLSR